MPATLPRSTSQDVLGEAKAERSRLSMFDVCHCEVCSTSKPSRIRTSVSRVKLSWTKETDTARDMAHAERRQGGIVGGH
jgi:hypothetical protein